MEKIEKPLGKLTFLFYELILFIEINFQKPLHSGNAKFYLLNGKGLQTTNGFGMLIVQMDQIWGPVLNGLEADGEGCLPDHLCRTMGYNHSISWLAQPNSYTGLGNSLFTFNHISCPADHNVSTLYRRV